MVLSNLHISFEPQDQQPILIELILCLSASNAQAVYRDAMVYLGLAHLGIGA